MDFALILLTIFISGFIVGRAVTLSIIKKKKAKVIDFTFGRRITKK